MGQFTVVENNFYHKLTVHYIALEISDFPIGAAILEENDRYVEIRK